MTVSEIDVRAILVALLPKELLQTSRVDDCARAIAAMINAVGMMSDEAIKHRTVIEAHLVAMRIPRQTKASEELDSIMREIDTRLHGACRLLIATHGLGRIREAYDDAARSNGIPPSHWWAYPATSHRVRAAAPSVARQHKAKTRPARHRRHR